MTTPPLPSSLTPLVDNRGTVAPVWQRWFFAVSLKLQSAAQITGLATVATTGNYSDLSGLPTLGTAAATDVTDYATAAQGIEADNAVPNTRNVNTTAGDLTGGGALSADLTLSLATTSVTAGTYGAKTDVPVVTVDSKGRLTAASTVSTLETLSTVATDTDFTWTYGTDSAVIIHSGTLTADRTVTLSGGAANGQRGRFVRTGSGAFNLVIGGLKNLATGTWCEVAYDGTAWVLIGYGSL